MDTMVESAPYTKNCIKCGAPADATVVEVLTGGRHQWDLHGTCPNCGNEWYECDFEAPPASVRAAILAANGPSMLDLMAGSASPAVVMRVLRQVRSLSLSQARAMADDLLRIGLRGTLVEMESLARPLRAVGAVVSIRASSADDL
ncbi:hypothetical protein GPX89_32385 [Nocardia sp. ET3-3]|uniref:Uncharacterized protein n=1 Tax=Nocardia terrae TaxID=2675851 RepID=A0A7K1V5L9_9NOCA|nr:hypothetical protein [Nocardia terrae]MVU81924.1 hypothetical protein [Nocardia terrae]